MIISLLLSCWKETKFRWRLFETLSNKLHLKKFLKFLVLVKLGLLQLSFLQKNYISPTELHISYETFMIEKIVP